MKKVIVALSGGVDSSVAAALLKSEGWQVEGVFMKNWSPNDLQSLSDCPWQQDQEDALTVCEKLGIPFRSLNFEKEYKQKVVDYFLNEYAAGRTPNPDVMCNKEIKFAVFLEAAQALGADYIATGHYAQKKEINGEIRLFRGIDPGKDQSYFLYTLTKNKLEKALFPIGHLPKSEVRRLAAEFGLPTANKKDSQGICFIGHLELKKYLQEQLGTQPGKAYILPGYEEEVNLEQRIEKAVWVGEHPGAAFYTIGERAGETVNNRLYSQIRGQRDVPPIYVLTKNAQTNALYLTDSSEDPHFRSAKLVLSSWQFTGEDSASLSEVPIRLQKDGETWLAQVRYQQKELVPVSEAEENTGRLSVEVALPYLKAVAPGQSLVVYKADGQVVGGGIIEEVLPVPI